MGITGRLVGSAGSWSGIPAGLAEGFGHLGIETFFLTAEPHLRTTRLLQRWLRLTGRLDASWAQTPEMMTTRAALVFLRRYRRGYRRATRAWIQMGSEFGHPLGPRFVTFDDMTVAQAVAMPDYVPLRARVARAWIERQKAIYRRAHACCVASHWAADGLVAYGVPRSKIRVTGFGCNLRVDAADRDWSTPRFLFVGLEWPRKNGDAVVAAFERVRREHPRASLTLVGDHPRVDLEGVEGLGPLRLGVETEKRRLEELFRRSTCLVVPSTYEPFGIVYAEAGWAGMPSIGTTVGGAPDAIGDGGIAVDPHDPAALLAAMRAMAAPARAASLGAAARAHAGLLSWEAVSGRVAAALEIVDPGEHPELPIGRPLTVDEL